MAKLRKKLARAALRFVIAAAVFVLTPKDWLRSMTGYVRWIFRNGVGLDRILRYHPRPLILFALFLLLMLVGLVSALRCLVLLGRIARCGAQGEDGPSPVRAARDAEEAVRCQHAGGREKYLEQLDSYLESGLIDKAEYRQMRERYERVNIPDDYH